MSNLIPRYMRRRWLVPLIAAPLLLLFGWLFPKERPYVASREGEVYHVRNCRRVEEITDANRLEYARPGQARSDGKRRCKACSPP